MRKIILTLLLLPIFAFANTNAVVYNATENRIVEGSLHCQEVSIASISKLMTVYTILKQNQDMNEILLVENKRTPNTKISKGMKLSRQDLINLALISSDNLAAQTLAENFTGGYGHFIRMMNEHAKELGMDNTRFVEPTGLSPMNYSTIGDIIKLTNAVSEFDIVKNAAKSHTVVAQSHKGKKTIKVSGNSTSKYFGSDGLVAIKTGFTSAAGFCITMLIASNNKLYNIVILGAKTKKERQLLVEKSLKVIYNT
jgi:D-alanyl-D-alanine endopeptidase (penicillin-binding protein 7)